jgi:hypothetical protein
MRKIFKFKEVIAIIISIASSLIFIPGKYLKLTETQLATYPALLNIIALVLGLLALSTFNNEYYLIKRKHGEYDESGLADLKSISDVLKIPADKSKYFVERTSAIVGQLVGNFSLFLWPLIIFYILNIIKDSLQLRIMPEFQYYTYSEFITCYPNMSVQVFHYLLISALANVFNFISGIGLWVCFSILFQKTLDADNKSTLHFGVYYFLLVAYILAYIILLGIGNFLSIKNTILTLDLICSVFNCVAMILFFNRLVQVLYFYQSALREKLLDKFYFFIVTVLFPFYACFQIFFVVFDQIAKDDPSYAWVKGIVFFVCFLGKLFLILFLYSFIRIKWLHAAILTLIAYEDIPSALAKNVAAISGSIDSMNDDIKDLKD